MEDLNDFVDETGKKLGLSEDGIAKAKEELIAAINKRDEQFETKSNHPGSVCNEKRFS